MAIWGWREEGEGHVRWNDCTSSLLLGVCFRLVSKFVKLNNVIFLQALSPGDALRLVSLSDLKRLVNRYSNT